MHAPSMMCLRKRPRRNCRKRAFTLVEVVIAMFVLTIIFGGVLGGLVRAEGMLASSRSTFRATVLLNEKVEELRANSFEGVAALGNGSGQFTATEVQSGGVVFAWERMVTSESGNADTLVARVRVTWQENQSPRRIEAVTYVARNGIVNKAAQ